MRELLFIRHLINPKDGERASRPECGSEYAGVKEINARNNLFTVVRADGTERTYNTSQQ
ncbi:MAG: hypothetical protein ABSF28_20795 [Terracidiphilus sp.]